MRKGFTFLIAVMALFVAMMVPKTTWGQASASIDFSEQGYLNQQEIQSAEIDGNVTVTFSKGSNSNAPKYYTSGTAIRCYGGNTITVSTSVGSLTSITLTFGASDGSNAITANVGTFTSPTWTGTSGSVTFTIGGTTGNRRIKGISVEYTSGGGMETVVTPVISPASCNFLTSQEVSIACATEGATIVYTTDDWTSQQNYSAPFTVTETTTVKAKATKSGMSDSNEATATYTKTNVLTTMDAIFAASATTGKYHVSFNNYVISEYKGSNAYITDGTKGFIIYKSGHGFQVGDVLNGIAEISLTRYNGSAETTDLTSTTTGITVTPGGTVTPIVASIADLSGVNTGSLITLNNVRFDGTNFVDADDNAIKPYNNFMTLPTFTQGIDYNITGIYLQYNSTKEIAPRNSNDIEEAQADKYQISITTQGQGSVTTSPASEAAGGAVVTINITPEPHNYLSSLTVNTVTDGEPVEVNEDNQFTMPNDDVQINAQFQTKALYTVTYRSLGSQIGTEQVYAGELCANVPTVTNTPEGWNFLGWSTETTENVATTAPAAFSITTPIEANTILNAVFIRVEGGAGESWVATDLADLTSDDVFVITGTNEKGTYSMSNNNGAGSAPTATSVTIENDLLTGEVTDSQKWNISGNATDGYVFYPNGDSEKWLYCTNSNNGVRVGTGDAKAMTLTEGYLTAPTTDARYIGIYNNSDWRCYTHADGPNAVTNIKNQTFAYYKNISGTTYYTTVNPVTESYTVTIDNTITHGTIEADLEEALAGATITLTVTPDAHYTLVNNSLAVMGEESSDLYETTLEEDGTYTFTMPAEDVYVSAEFAAVPTYTYIYSVNGVDSEEIVVNQTNNVITLATSADINSTFRFAGWSLSENDFTQLMVANSNYTLTDDAIFYAVYSRTAESAGESSNYSLVTEQLSNWCGDYLISYTDELFLDGSLPGGTSTGQAGYKQSSVNLSSYITDNSIPAETGDSYYLTVEAINDNDLSQGYVLKTHAETNPYIYVSQFKNGMSATANKSTAANYPIAITFDENGKVSMAITFSDGKMILAYNVDATSGDVWRFYKDTFFGSGNGQNGRLPIVYKKTSDVAPDVEYFTRIFMDEIATENITISGPSIIPAGHYLKMGGLGSGYKLTNTNAENLIIEDGAMLFHRFEDDDQQVACIMQKNITGYSTSETDNYYLISTPSVNDLAVSNTNLVASEAANYDLYSYNEPTAYWMNYKAGNFSALEYGNGYLYANKDDITLSFTIDDLNGTQFSNNEELSHTGTSLNGFNLVGNPYACLASVRYLNKQDENHALTPCPYYRMNEDGNALILDNSGKRIAPMEAVFVQYQADNFYDEYAYVSVTSYDVEDEVESSTINPSINITVSKAVRGAHVLNNAIVNLRGSYNIDKLMLSESTTRISIVNDGKEYGSYCVANENTLPVFFKADEDGLYTITVTLNNTEMNYLHIIDNLTGNDVDLLENNQYTFDAKVSDYTSRFKLVFQEKNNVENVASNENFAIFADGNLIIEHEGENTLQVIDMMGHTLSTEIFNGSYNKAVNLAAGVYVLKMTSGNEENCQKIVVR